MTFGQLGTGALAGTTLDFTAKFSLTTTDPGTSFVGNLIIGDPPGATPAPTRFASAQMAAMTGAAGSPWRSAPVAPTPRPCWRSAGSGPSKRHLSLWERHLRSHSAPRDGVNPEVRATRRGTPQKTVGRRERQCRAALPRLSVELGCGSAYGAGADDEEMPKQAGAPER